MWLSREKEVLKQPDTVKNLHTLLTRLSAMKGRVCVCVYVCVPQSVQCCMFYNTGTVIQASSPFLYTVYDSHHVTLGCHSLFATVEHSGNQHTYVISGCTQQSLKVTLLFVINQLINQLISW